MLKVGSVAPDFELVDNFGKKVKLSDFKGQKVVLYFYPKDNTSGCTKQALGYKELYSQFMDKGAIVIGISKDSTNSHQKFISNYALPFILLSDPELDAIKKYEVWGQKKLYGKEYFGVVRSSYIIDENGIIQGAYEKVNATTNANDMLCQLN